jgi:hypothetical protein
MELLGDGVVWNLVSVLLGMVLVSLQDMCMVCAKHNMGLKNVLYAPDGPPR